MRRTAIARRTDGRAVMDGSNACSVRWGTDPERLRVYDTPELAEQSRQLLCDEDDEALSVRCRSVESWRPPLRCCFLGCAPLAGGSTSQMQGRLSRRLGRPSRVACTRALRAGIWRRRRAVHAARRAARGRDHCPRLRTCGDGFSPAAELGDAWESIPEWARL